MHLSTLTTCNRYILCYFVLNCVESFDTHNIFPFAYNFLNNGPIFNLIRLLELSPSPVASCDVTFHVFRFLTYMS